MEALLREKQDAESLSEAELLLDQIPQAIEQSAAQQYAKRHAESVIALCREISAAELSDQETLALASEMLDRLEPDGSPNTAVEELKSTLAVKSNELRSASLAEAVKADLDVLESQLANAIKLSDPELRHSVLVSLNQSIESLRVQLALQGHVNELAATVTTKDKIKLHVDGMSGVLIQGVEKELLRAKAFLWQ
jgi:hypothetical protein